MARDLPPRGMIFDPWLPEKGLAMIYSPRGMGKTLFAMPSAYVIAAGAEFLGCKAPIPRRVLYVDGEMPARTMQERLAAIIAGVDRQPLDPSVFRFLSSDLTEHGLPDLGTSEGQDGLDAIAGPARPPLLRSTSPGPASKDVGRISS